MNEKKLFDQILQAFPVIRNYIPQDIKGLSERFLNYVLDEETYIPSPSLESYLNNYLCTIDKRYKSTTEKAIRHFLDFYNFSFEYINEDDILKFIQEEYSKGNSQGYIRVVISRLRQFYSFLEKENVISVNPFENINLSTLSNRRGATCRIFCPVFAVLILIEHNRVTAVVFSFSASLLQEIALL